MSAQVLPFLGRPDGADDASELFDEVMDLFSQRTASEAMTRLVQGLHGLRRTLSAGAWRAVKSDWMQHPLARIVHQDPLTSWSYRKPRGYPGDARLLDFVDGGPCVAADIAAATELGRAIYACTSRSRVAVGLRERRHIVADTVDRVARKAAGKISVLSLAAGHLREADCSQALTNDRVARWVALDHDPDNLALLRKRFAGSVVEVCDGTACGLIEDDHKLGQFDLISAAGLYDHLEATFARRLTEAAFRKLKPGGTLLFSNIVCGIETDGFMETFMGWPLIDRNEDAMAKIWSDLPTDEIAVRWLFTDANQAMIYALVQRI
ncbi:methyltransferase domain-containing protein [Bradyrhizobium sp. STM 3557]|uniref:methyltransferase domain-containing protein n=1 Tax=Bradyrhizobium sp. STM 3557 TaxID=578920 RepID=UPI00388E523E